MAFPAYNFHFSYGLCMRALAINPHKNQNRVWLRNAKLSIQLAGIIGFVPLDVCAAKRRECEQTCARSFTFKFFFFFSYV